MVLLFVKATSAISITLGTIDLPQFLKDMDIYFRDDELSAELAENPKNRMNYYCLVQVMFYAIYIICISRMMYLMSYHRDRAYKLISKELKLYAFAFVILFSINTLKFLIYLFLGTLSKSGYDLGIYLIFEDYF